MFKKKKLSVEPNDGTPQPAKKAPGWLKLSIIANIVLVVAALGGVVALWLLHQSDTNPSFCGTCHIMDKNVTSYLTGPNLDHLHDLAGVECKECHEYPIPAEIASGIKFVTGNFEVGSDGELLKRKYNDSMCLQCHISYDFVAENSADLDKNPHNSHLGQMPCSTCHVSHGEQVDYCSQCHDHGEQEMIIAPDAEKKEKSE